MTLYADLPYNRPQFTLTMHFRAIKWQLYIRFDFISGDFISGYYWMLPFLCYIPTPQTILSVFDLFFCIWFKRSPFQFSLASFSISRVQYLSLFLSQLMKPLWCKPSKTSVWKFLLLITLIYHAALPLLSSDSPDSNLSYSDLNVYGICTTRSILNPYMRRFGWLVTL